MDMHIIDGMKKEAKAFKYYAILGYILSLLMLLYGYLINNESYSDKDTLLIFFYCFMLSSIGLYCWLYAIKYKVEITKEKVILITLFRKKEINITDITHYTRKRYRKSVFYQFKLYTQKQSILVNTRYKDEFEKILEKTQ